MIINLLHCVNNTVTDANVRRADIKVMTFGASAWKEVGSEIKSAQTQRHPVFSVLGPSWFGLVSFCADSVCRTIHPIHSTL